MAKLPPSVRKFLNDNLKKARAAKAALAKKRNGGAGKLSAGDIAKMSKAQLRKFIQTQ